MRTITLILAMTLTACATTSPGVKYAWFNAPDKTQQQMLQDGIRCETDARRARGYEADFYIRCMQSQGHRIEWTRQ